MNTNDKITAASDNALPGLESIGLGTPEVAAQKGVALIPTPARVLDAGGWYALEHLPKGVTPEMIKKQAKVLAADPDLDQLSFINLIKEFDVDSNESVDRMLASNKARNAGEAGQRVVMITQKCRGFGASAPKPSEKFMERYNSRVATAKEVLGWVKWLAKKLDAYSASFDDLKDLTDGEVTYHKTQSNLSVEATANDLQISKDEAKREDELIKITALCEALQEELAGLLSGELDERDRTRLNNVSLLCLARIKNLRPMCQDANAAVRRFALASNSNALTALDQWDFATAGLAAWKRNIAGEIDSKKNIIMNMAYLEAINFTAEQEEATIAAFDAQMDSMMQVFTSQMATVDMIERMTASLESAGDKLAQGLQTAHDQSEEAADVIGKCKERIEKSEKKLSSETVRILGKK